MKGYFFKRLCAYLIDVLIVTFIVSIITIRFNVNNDYMKRFNDLMYGVNSGDVKVEDYSNEIFEFNYEYQKSMIPSTIVSVVINIGYFVIFAALNKGQTLGKKIFRIRLVSIDGKDPSIWNMFKRSMFLYGIFIGIINVVSVSFLSVRNFNYTSTIVNYIYYVFIITCFFMVMKRKDGRGIHDIIGGTSVKEEVK